MALDRRSLLAGTAAGAAALVSKNRALAADKPSGNSIRTFCAFVKYIQELPYDRLAETVAELGFDGIEATVR